MTGQKLELEITFLYDVRKIINSVRGRCEDSYMDLISILDETYQLAVDWNIASTFKESSRWPQEPLGDLDFMEFSEYGQDQESLQSFDAYSDIDEESERNLSVGNNN